MTAYTKYLHRSGIGQVRSVSIYWQWQGFNVWLLTVFVNHLFPGISLIRRICFWNGNYYSCWWIEIMFLLIANPLFSQPPTAHLSHSPPRPPLIELIIARCMHVCVCVCCIDCVNVYRNRMWLGLGKTAAEYTDLRQAQHKLDKYQFFGKDIQMLDRGKEIIKARTSVSILVKGMWMRAYPIIGCLHLSCYPRG